MITTKTHPCKAHTYQDKAHPGKRVFTTLSDNKGYRCTVCGTVQTKK